MEQTVRKRGLSSFWLKVIAITSMLIDHTGAVLFPEYRWMRIVGRIAFPVFAFLLVEGFVHTSSRKKYILRMGVFALLSEIPFDLAFYGKPLGLEHQNVFFSLFLGLLMLEVLSSPYGQAERLGVSAAILLLAEGIRTDYGMTGLLMIFSFWAFRGNRWRMSLAAGASNLLLWGRTQKYALLGLLPVLCYNGERGYRIKYVFYFFYPVHLLVLAGIRMWMETM